MNLRVDHSSGIEIRHLSALEAVAAEGSFRRAAGRLGYVQSAISDQIAALERIVGQRLVERSRGSGPVELTEAGEVLLSHAKAIVARVKAAEADLGALADGSAGSLRLGIYQSVGARIIPRLLPRYARDWPDVPVLPREAPTDAGLFELVERGELELSFADLPLHPGPFGSVELLSDPYVLLVDAASPLAQGGPVGLDGIAGLPLIGHWTCRVRGGRARGRHAGAAARDLALLAPGPLPLTGGAGVRGGRARGLRADLGRARRHRSPARSALPISVIGKPSRGS